MTNVVLIARSSCDCCHGKGYFVESHGDAYSPGESMVCDCPFEDATEEQIAAMESGVSWVILPDPSCEQEDVDEYDWDDDCFDCDSEPDYDFPL